jgi:outer membrane protein
MSRLLIRVLFAALCLPLVGMAQTSTPAASAAGPQKIVWIDLNAAILSCDQGKAEFAELQKFMDAKRAEMDALKKEVDDLQRKVEVQGPKLSDEARDELEMQYESKNTALQRFQQDAQKELEARQNRIANAIGKKMAPVIKKYAEEKGISSVEILNQSRDAYIAPSVIVTEDIVKAYNQTYANEGAKAPIAPAKKP